VAVVSRALLFAWCEESLAYREHGREQRGRRATREVLRLFGQERIAFEQCADLIDACLLVLQQELKLSQRIIKAQHHASVENDA